MRGKSPWGPGKVPKKFLKFCLEKVSITMVRSDMDFGRKLKKE